MRRRWTSWCGKSRQITVARRERTAAVGGIEPRQGGGRVVADCVRDFRGCGRRPSLAAETDQGAANVRGDDARLPGVRQDGGGRSSSSEFPGGAAAGLAG